MGQVGVRQQLENRLSVLQKERTLWEDEWEDITDQMLPYRFERDSRGQHDRNRGERKPYTTSRGRGAPWVTGTGDTRNNELMNGTPIRALRTLAAGMMAGITSPARPWFNLGVDKELGKIKSVRVYLDQVEQIIAQALQVSNWYDVLSNGVYLDLGSIATSSVLMEEDFETGLRFTEMRSGSYWLDQNSKGIIDTCIRKLFWTTRQIVEKFGIDNASPLVQDGWRAQRFNETWTVIQAIVPNVEIKNGSSLSDGMPFASYWWEQGNPRKDQFLRVSGYREFPVLAPRWSTTGNDVYGRGPGWDVRGDCKSLQHLAKRRLQMVDKTVTPPIFMQGYADKVSMLPGAVTHVPMGQDAKATPLVDIAPGAMVAILQMIDSLEGEIDKTMFVHLWNSTLMDERVQRATATEIEARRQEVMLMLGPLLQSLNNDLLEPCISRAYSILNRLDALPLPPEELEGRPFSVNFISILHQAQQATGAAGLRALMEEMARLIQLDPNVGDKFNADAAADSFGNMFGVPAEVMRSEDEVRAMREERAAAQKAQEEGEAMLAATEGVKNLGQSDPESVNELVGQFSPAAAASAGLGA